MTFLTGLLLGLALGVPLGAWFAIRLGRVLMNLPDPRPVEWTRPSEWTGP